MPGFSGASRIRPGTCGHCAWFLPPFQDLYWKGRVRRQVPGRCSVRENEPRFRDQTCDLHEDGPPVGSDPSHRMSQLNHRMKRKNSAIKRRCVEGMRRVRQDPIYRMIQRAVLEEIMTRPGMREKAIAHAVAINRKPEVRAKQWASRRAKKAAARELETAQT